MLYRALNVNAFILASLLLTGCGGGGDDDSSSVDIPSGGSPIVDVNPPVVTSEPTYTVLKQEDITYAEGLSHDESSTSSFAIPLKLDVYYPDNNATNRPVFMFIHGGGFTGGVKDGPEMVEMANFYASRGWVFFSIDYRTTEELCNAKESSLCRNKVQQMLQSDALNGTDEVLAFYRGFAPVEWIEYALPLISSVKELQQTIAMYAAQRDAKAALRWIVANANAYNINTNFISVGGNSAGSATAVTLGVTNQDDFRDEITITDDPTLSTTNLDQTFQVQGMVHFWGTTAVLDYQEAVYDLPLYDRFDANDPELFMGHGEAYDPQSPFEEALELKSIFDGLGVHNELKILFVPLESDPTVLVPGGHGAWNGVEELGGKSLFEMSFDFLVERQQLVLQ